MYFTDNKDQIKIILLHLLTWKSSEYTLNHNSMLYIL